MPAADGPFVIKNALITVDGVDYPNQCTKSRLVPDVPMQTVRTLVPDGAVTDVDSALWTWEVSMLQVNKVGGLSRALRTLDIGDQVTVVMAPNNKSGEDKATFTIVVKPTPFGGDQGKFADAEMEFGVIGQPIFSTI